MNPEIFHDFLFPGTFCKTILLKEPITIVDNGKRRLYLDEKYNVDTCCRTLLKCDANKHNELNHTNEWNFRHCDCENSFQICLGNLKTPLSNELALMYSINTTKCYAIDYPIINCIEYESYAESTAPFLRFVNSAEREKFFNRCSKYELDENQQQELQLFDLPFNYSEVSTNGTNLLPTLTFFLHQCKLGIENSCNFEYFRGKCNFVVVRTKIF